MMPPYFRFMTGATTYRIHARDKTEAIEVAFSELQPTEDAKAVILKTMYDENDGLRYSMSSDEVRSAGLSESGPDSSGDTN